MGNMKKEVYFKDVKTIFENCIDAVEHLNNHMNDKDFDTVEKESLHATAEQILNVVCRKLSEQSEHLH